MIFQKSKLGVYFQIIRQEKARLGLKDRNYHLFQHLVICCCKNGGDPELKTTTTALATEFLVTRRTIHNRLNTLIRLNLVMEKIRLSNGILLKINTSIFLSGEKKIPTLSKDSFRKNSIVELDFKKELAKEKRNSWEYTLKTLDHLTETLYPTVKFKEDIIKSALKELHANYFLSLDDEKIIESYVSLCRLIDNAKKWIDKRPGYVIPSLLTYLKNRNTQSGFSLWRLVHEHNRNNKRKLIRTIQSIIIAEAKKNRLDYEQTSSALIAAHAQIVKGLDSPEFNQWFIDNAKDHYSI